MKFLKNFHHFFSICWHSLLRNDEKKIKNEYNNKSLNMSINFLYPKNIVILIPSQENHLVVLPQSTTWFNAVMQPWLVGPWYFSHREMINQLQRALFSRSASRELRRIIQRGRAITWCLSDLFTANQAKSYLPEWYKECL